MNFWVDPLASGALISGSACFCRGLSTVRQAGRKPVTRKSIVPVVRPKTTSRAGNVISPLIAHHARSQRQPDAASDPPLRLLADVDAASRLPETFAVAASPVRHTPLVSDQDRSNCRREENTDHHVAARVMSTTKPDPPPVRRTRTTS